MGFVTYYEVVERLVFTVLGVRIGLLTISRLRLVFDCESLVGLLIQLFSFRAERKKGRAFLGQIIAT